MSNGWHARSAKNGFAEQLHTSQARDAAAREDAEVQQRLQRQEEALAAARAAAATAVGEAQAARQRCDGLNDVLAAAQGQLQQLQVRNTPRSLTPPRLAAAHGQSAAALERGNTLTVVKLTFTLTFMVTMWHAGVPESVTGALHPF